MAKGVGGDPAFQGDPGLLLEILEILYYYVVRPSASRRS